MMIPMSARVMTRRGLRRGARSATFSVAELADQVSLQHRLKKQHNVYMELDSSGLVTCRDGVAQCVARAPLACSSPAASLLLCAVSCDEAPRLQLRLPCDEAPRLQLRLPCDEAPRLQLRLPCDVAPHADLALWFDETLLALLDMPFLTLRNITGKRNYACHDCGAEFEQPNSLKVHLFLKCQPHDQAVFWRKCIVLLKGSSSESEPCDWLVPTVTSASATVTSPAELESLAAAWGRSRDGHVCLYCGKLYSRKYGLKIHIRTHTGYKPLRCRHCLRAFGDPSNLNKHVRLHASASAPASTLHSCSLCGKTLARRRDLQRHHRTHHAHLPAP